MAEDDVGRPAEAAANREISLFMRARSGCIILLAISEYKALYLSIPSAAIAAVSLRRVGGFYMPLAIDAILAAVLIMQMGARWTFKYNEGAWWLDSVSDFVMGMFLCLIGIILVYILVRRMPGLDRENGIISVIAFSFGFSMSMIIILCSFTTTSLVEGNFSESREFASAGEMTSAIFGAGVMSVLFYLNRNSLLFQNTLKGPLGKLLSPFMMRHIASRPQVKKAECIGCEKCARICPAKAIEMRGGRPRIDRSACIRCFCCQEFCPKGAMKVVRPPLARLLNK